MIVATAGHVDHGKTSLIKHLTGIDTDKLEEEKRRGLTIELGFAYRPVNENTTLGFIDVPGHSRFINTMIAGVSGIDLGMLVVAADDGPMPQTHEHLAVMQLLGVKEFIVVITKTDKVEPVRIEQVLAELAALIPECKTFFTVSNIQPHSIEPLRAWLDHRANEFEQRSSGGNFRLPVDRVFTLKGIGMVVTGTAASGQLAPGDELEVLPGGGTVRVRSLRVQNEKAEVGRAGDRCALNIAGGKNIARGSTLATPGSLHSSTNLDARLSLLSSATHPLKHLSPARLYIGTRRLPCRVYFIDELESGHLNPGQNTLVQLILNEPVVACNGDHFLLRDDSESMTLGGGTILDPAAPKEGKSRRYRLDYLSAMQKPSVAEALTDLLQPGSPPVNISTLRKSWNLPDAQLRKLLHARPVEQFNAGAEQFIVSMEHWNKALQGLRTLLENWHKSNPQAKGISAIELQAHFLQKQIDDVKKALFKALTTRLMQEGELTLAGGLISASNYKQTLSPTQQSHWRKAQEELLKCGILVPTIRELSITTTLTQEQLSNALEASSRIHLVHKLNSTRYGLPGHLMEHAKIVTELATAESGLTVISYKNRIGSGRKLAIEILEYFDALRFTQRRGDARVIIDPTVPEKLFAR